jgi:glycopeptide antibiotics resistance protein
MVMPRKTPTLNGTTSNQHFFQSLIHEILFYGGPLEPVANFLLLVPMFLLLPALSRKIKPGISLAICSGLAAASEIIQIYIPGRYSSTQDFALNCLGAFLAYVILIILTKFKNLN